MYNKNQWYSYTCNVKESYIRNKFLISCHSQVHHHSVFNGMVRSAGDRVALTDRKCKKHVATSKLYEINLQ